MALPTAQTRAQQMKPEVLSQFFYTYSATTAAIASGASGSAQVAIQADSAFMVQYLAAFVYNGTTFAEIASPIATVQITDTGSGTQLFDAAQYIRNVFGTASLPNVLPTVRVLQPNASLLVTVNNVNSANAAIFQFAFMGQKLYRR